MEEQCLDTSSNRWRAYSDDALIGCDWLTQLLHVDRISD